MSLLRPLSQLRSYEFRFVPFTGILFQEVREEEYLEDGKHDEELYADNQPQRPPKCH